MQNTIAVSYQSYFVITYQHLDCRWMVLLVQMHPYKLNYFQVFLVE